MKTTLFRTALSGLYFSLLSLISLPASSSPVLLEPSTNIWVKRSPLPDAPTSPRMGYEGACVWDSQRELVIRYGGHNQGGGGEQGAEVWTFDPRTAQWTLKEPNTSPPGVCCNAQNVYDPVSARYLRFPFFSGNHGWQWWRELYLNDSSVWSYDPASNCWRNLRPYPTPRLAGLRCASWDSDEEVVVVFGGEGSHEGTLIYDPYPNAWRWPKPARQPDFRSGGNMVYDAARKVHVLFGAQFSDDRHTWTYDVRRNEWRDMQPPVMPPTKENDAVLTYDPIHRMVIALVKITTGKDESARHRVETWAYDTGANRWTQKHPTREPDNAGNRTRQLLFAPELNLAILENCTHQPREQQIWTYRYAGTSADGRTVPAAAKSRLQPPSITEATVSVLSPTRVEVAWRTSNDKSITGYHVERAAVEVLTEDQLVRLKRHTPPLLAPSVGAIRRVGPFQRLTQQPLQETGFTDTTVDLSKPLPAKGNPVYDHALHADHLDPSGKSYRFAVFAYRVQAVNAAGTQSGPSPAVFTIPSSPQWVFSREDGTACQLKWAANPEKTLQGYRVYRLDGRWDKDPISRLTTEPISATTYRDATAGKSTRRYYIVAVDALDQEGFPSSPVWFEREWKPYYESFTGEWHQ